MKSLSKKEFESECQKLQFRGKCAILLVHNKMQNISRVSLEYKDSKLKNMELLQNSMDEKTSAVLVNLEISSKFPFYKVQEIMNELLQHIPYEIDLVLTATYDDDKDIKEASITVVTSTTKKFLTKMIKSIEGAIKPFQKCFKI